MCAALLSLIAAAGCATPGVSVGMTASRWRANDSMGVGTQADARVALSEHVAVQTGLSWQTTSQTAPMGQPTIPDVRSALVFTPRQNRYLVPHVMLGFGRARYADNRISLLGGVGVEIVVRPWLRLVGQWTVIAPDPMEVVEQIQQRRAGGDEMPIEGMLREHYNLRTSEVTLGYRLTY